MASGTVKWFNTAKGFGFIAPEEGGTDVFVHASALERASLRRLNEGDRVSYDLEEDRRSGKLAAANLRVTGAGSAPSGRSVERSSTRPADGTRSDQPRPRSSQEPSGRQVEGSGRGMVKWFNTAKGFGFIAPEGGGEDVFVHVSAVERAGLRALHEGEPVSYDLERDARSGKMAAGNLRVER